MHLPNKRVQQQGSWARLPDVPVPDEVPNPKSNLGLDGAATGGSNLSNPTEQADQVEHGRFTMQWSPAREGERQSEGA